MIIVAISRLTISIGSLCELTCGDPDFPREGGGGTRITFTSITFYGPDEGDLEQYKRRSFRRIKIDLLKVHLRQH